MTVGLGTTAALAAEPVAGSADQSAAATPAPASAADALASVLDASVAVGTDGSYTVSWTGLLASAQMNVYASNDAADPARSGTKVASSRTGSAVVSGLDPAKRWYFKVVPAGTAYGVVTAPRAVGEQGALNTRDLGGYRTSWGLTVKYGQVFRSDGLGRLTDAGVAKLGSLGLNTAYDFRVDGEIGSNGPNKLPAGVSSQSVPLSDGGVVGLVVQAVSSGDPVKQQALLGDGKAAKFLEDVNRSFVDDPAKRAQFGTVLKAIANGDKVLFNCSAGKDRTGWMAAVVLTALGVDKDTVYRDYLASNDYLKPSIDATLNGMVASGALKDPELVRPLLGVQASYLDAAFDEVRAVYGSFDAYLRDGLGIDGLTLAQLKLRLLTV
ncbi:tyrosine-protein phosphatase [Yinghuangia seranimata]|uniref:tyrosine-protein phosphatase n=1 Tax=Yinghuangia seranimata TaxID=408067 RepID=UPI00248CECA5|nr:tyrosine-protein phosphatase [Yinghuangia seranimata]MDI2127783.1 tyrosine-protein phosphatase [Yinghuangia seranimata]